MNKSKTQTITAKCTADQSVTVGRSVSAGVSAEAFAWIFAKVNLSLSTIISKSVTSGYSTSATFKVKSKKTGYCTRGVVTKGVSAKIQVVTVKYYYDKKGKPLRKSTSTKKGTVKGTGPVMGQWRIS